MAYRPKHIAEYLALRIVVGLVWILPYRILLFIAWVAAGVSFPLLRKRLRETKRRIVSVMGTDTPPAEIRRIAWISWRNMYFNAFETLRIPHRSESMTSRPMCASAAQFTDAHVAVDVWQMFSRGRLAHLKSFGRHVEELGDDREPPRDRCA